MRGGILLGVRRRRPCGRVFTTQECCDLHNRTSRELRHWDNRDAGSEYYP